MLTIYALFYFLLNTWPIGCRPHPNWVRAQLRAEQNPL